jgi:putative ABC transport system permease protein
MSGALDIGLLPLSLVLVFVLLAGAASLKMRLGLERDLLWGTLRTVSQLVLLGFVLTWIFQVRDWYIVLAMYTVMIFFAARIIRGRVRSGSVRLFFPVFFSMLLSYMLVSVFVVTLIVDAEPWYRPDYFLPLGGMIIGNSMNAIAISLDRLFTDLSRRRQEIELRLICGATARQASADIVRDAVRAGMIPSINAMMGVGLVFIPGMMTGQILAGSDPFVAVKYQIMVMLMLVGSTALGSLLVVSLLRSRSFNREQQLVLQKPARA